MVCCCAFGCSNRSDRKDPDTTKCENPKMTFHLFPKDINRRIEWTKAVGRKDWIPNNTSVICSDHFTKDCFDRSLSSCTRLKKHAVPTIFGPSASDLEEHFPRKKPGRKKRLSDELQIEEIFIEIVPDVKEEPPEIDEVFETMPVKKQNFNLSNEEIFTNTQQCISEEINEIRKCEDLSLDETSLDDSFIFHTCSCIIRMQNIMKEKEEKYQKKIKILQQQNRRNIKKIATMKKIIKSLKEVTCDKNNLKRKKCIDR